MSDKAWSLIRRKVDEGIISVEDVLAGLGKLSFQTCIDAGMTNNQAQAIGTLYDILIGAAEYNSPHEGSSQRSVPHPK